MNSDTFNPLKLNTNLDFGNPPRVVFGVGTSQNSLPGLVKEIDPKKTVLVSDEVVAKTGALEKIGASLKSAGLKYEELLIPIGEPTTEMTRDLVNSARKDKPDLYVGVGGGSVLDMTKLMSIMVTNEGDPKNYYALPPDPWSDKVVKAGARKILLSTTAGTGSESSNTLVVTEAGYKTWITSSKVTANVSLVDPSLTYTLPPNATRNTGMDALSHLIEGVLTNMPNPVSDGMIQQGVHLISKYLIRAYNNGNDEEARVNMSFAAMMGGWVIAFPWVGGPATIGHCMSEALGPRFGIPHGFACAIMLPHAMDFNLPLVAPRLRPIAEAFGVDTYGLSDLEAASNAINSVVSMMKGLEMPVALKNASKFGKDRLTDMFDYVFNQRQYIYNLPIYNPRRLTEENLSELFDDIWEGKFTTASKLIESSL
ncbi:MAG: iron-containing alcohol dehydrogenase [Thermoplasmatales archaeon]|nr:iron-containing alcohol dehydrogenase [Thermoplasmatales archaeon]